MRADPDTTNVQFDWDEPAERSVHFEVDQTKARQLNISSQDIANYLQMTLSGYTITPVPRARQADRRRPARAGARARRSFADRAPGDAVAERHRRAACGARARLRYGLEYGVVWERDRQPTITVQSDVQHNAQGIDVTNRVDKALGSAARNSCRSAIASRSAARSRRTRRRRASINAQMPLLHHRRAGAADGPAAKLQPRADGGAHRAAGPHRRGDWRCCCSASRSASSRCSGRSRCSASSCATP